MYYMANICFLCLQNNIKVQSVLVEDTDGIVINVKLRCFFPEIIDSTPDAHKLACSECLEKLRISYDFKQSVLRNNTVFKDYIDKLNCEHKPNQQLLVELIRSKYRTINPFAKDVTGKKDEKCGEKHDNNSLKIQNENHNLTSTHQEQLFTQDQSCQLTTNENDVVLTKFSCQSKEEINLKTENIEIEEIYIKEERPDEEDFSRNYLDEESKESEDTNSTSSQSGYNDERVNKEAKKKRYKCREHPKTFTGPNELEVHTSPNSLITQKPTQTGEKSHKCEICQKSFKKKSNLVTHKRSSHENVRPYECSVCKKTFTRNNSLNTHMFIHTGHKPYHCQICQYKCTHAVNLKKHIIRTHTGKRPYTCDHCEKSYAWPNDLKEHIKKHHIEDV